MNTRVMINGREIALSDFMLTGEELKSHGDIASGRALILQRPEGNYLIGNKQRVQLQDGDYFSDAPNFEYG